MRNRHLSDGQLLQCAYCEGFPNEHKLKAHLAACQKCQGKLRDIHQRSEQLAQMDGEVECDFGCNTDPIASGVLLFIPKDEFLQLMAEAGIILSAVPESSRGSILPDSGACLN
jgi:hypothetical protein